MSKNPISYNFLLLISTMKPVTTWLLFALISHPVSASLEARQVPVAKYILTGYSSTPGTPYPSYNISVPEDGITNPISASFPVSHANPLYSPFRTSSPLIEPTYPTSHISLTPHLPSSESTNRLLHLPRKHLHQPFPPNIKLHLHPRRRFPRLRGLHLRHCPPKSGLCILRANIIGLQHRRRLFPHHYFQRLSSHHEFLGREQ